MAFLPPRLHTTLTFYPGPLHHPSLGRHHILRPNLDARRLVRSLLPSSLPSRANPTSSPSQAAGQNCIGVERFIVTAPIYSTFLSTMTPLVASLTVGDILAPRASDARSPDVGAMVSDRLFPKLEKLIEDAVAKGARCLVGGKRWKGEEGDRGSYFQPTLLVDVTEEMDIARCVCFFALVFAWVWWELMCCFRGEGRRCLRRSCA